MLFRAVKYLVSGGISSPRLAEHSTLRDGWLIRLILLQTFHPYGMGPLIDAVVLQTYGPYGTGRFVVVSDRWVVSASCAVFVAVRLY